MYLEDPFQDYLFLKRFIYGSAYRVTVVFRFPLGKSGQQNQQEALVWITEAS